MNNWCTTKCGLTRQVVFFPNIHMVLWTIGVQLWPHKASSLSSWSWYLQLIPAWHIHWLTIYTHKCLQVKVRQSLLSTFSQKLTIILCCWLGCFLHVISHLAFLQFWLCLQTYEELLVQLLSTPDKLVTKQLQYLHFSFTVLKHSASLNTTYSYADPRYHMHQTHHSPLHIPYACHWSSVSLSHAEQQHIPEDRKPPFAYNTEITANNMSVQKLQKKQ